MITATATATETGTTMAEGFSNPGNSISEFPLCPVLSLSQSDLSSCDTDWDPETPDFDLDPIFQPSSCDYPADHYDQVSFVTNLFNRSAENDLNYNSQLGLELGSGDNGGVDLELGLGLGSGLDSNSSRQPGEGRCHFEGLQVVGVDSDSEDEFLSDLDDVGCGFGCASDFDQPPFCWDYLVFNNGRSDSENLVLGRVDDNSHIQERELEISNIEVDDADDYGGGGGDGDDDDDAGAFFFGACRSGFEEDVNEDFETPILLDDDEDNGHREVGDDLILFDSYEVQDEQEVMIQSDTNEGSEFGVEEAIRDLEWEILLAVNNINREVYDMGFNVDMYEAIIDEVEDRMNDCKGSPPAAQSVIENLPVVCFSRERLEENSVVCAICKDEVSGEEMVRQLPCLHYYHGDCILPWLKMRNTCPVCRHELPTDDPEYEYRKREREELIADGDISLSSQVDYDFHVFL